MKDYHFHRCWNCATVWKHSDYEEERPPDAHTCPNCKEEEYARFPNLFDTIGNVGKHMLRVYCAMDLNGFVLPATKEKRMRNQEVYTAIIGHTVEITNGPLEGCRAKVYRAVTKYYFQASLIDAREEWEVGETVNLGPGNYKRWTDGTATPAPAERTVSSGTTWRPTGKNLLKSEG